MESKGTTFRVERFQSLTPSDLDTWRSLQASRLSWRSPFLAPEYVEAVASVRTDVWVGLILVGNRLAGIFPFQKDASDMAFPVGKGLCDFQAVLSAPESGVSAAALLRGCGLRGFVFDHLLAEQTAFQTGFSRVYDSPWLDLSRGFQAYVLARREKGSKLIPKAAWSRRKLAREVGPLVFREQDPSPAMLERLMALKSDQYRRSGSRDRFAESWIRCLLRHLQSRSRENFSGVLSTLHAGDRLVAAHMGMRTPWSWHYWFPAYDRQFAAYSPGTLLLLDMAAHAAELGIARFDLGRGEDAYKQRLQSGATPVARGRIQLLP